MVLLLLALALLAMVAQFAIDCTPDNVAASCLVMASALAILLYILWTDAIQTHPLSTFAIFGFCVTSQLGALLAQSGSGVSLTQNLRQPLETFAWLALFQAVALLAHALYRNFSKPQERHSSSVLRTLLERVGLYQTPSVGTLWLMGMMGVCGQLLGGLGETTIAKLAQGFAFIAWAPFLIPMFVAEVGSTYCNKQRNYFFLFIYIGFIAFLGLAANARGMMLSGLMTITMMSLLRAFRSQQPVQAVQVGKYALLLLVLGAMAIPVSDLMVAMTISRKARGTVSPLKMVEDTFYYVTQPEQLRMQRERDKLASASSSYDETYFDNPLLGRLMETKFHDNAMYFGQRLTERDQDRLWKTSVDFLWSTLPDPALKALRIRVDKDSLHYSMGDYLSYLGGAGGVGGFRTGSGFGQGLALFGDFFPVVYLCICPILFWAADVLSYRSAQGGVLVSALGMLGIWKLFQYGITGESLHYLFVAVVRWLPQNILVFLLTLSIARAGASALATLLGAGQTRQGSKPPHNRSNSPLALR